MKNQEVIRQAIFNMGGPKIAASNLHVSTSTIRKWARNGVIPKIEKAREVAKHSGFELSALRPPYSSKVVPQ